MHGPWGRTERSSIKELHGDHWGWVLGREREERPEGAVNGKTLKGYETRESCTKSMFLKGHTGCLGFPSGSDVKNLPAKQKVQVWSLSQEDPLEREWLPTQVFLSGTSMAEEPGGLQSMGSQRIRHNLSTKQQLVACDFCSGEWEWIMISSGGFSRSPDASNLRVMR